MTGPLEPFLTARLTEELAALWEREKDRPDSPDRPGLAAQVEVLDGLLSRLAAGRLERFELLLLLHCYGAHPGYDPGWAADADPLRPRVSRPRRDA